MADNYIAPEYIDVVTGDGTLRIVYEMSIGDLLVSSMLVLLLVFLILWAIIKTIWR